MEASNKSKTPKKPKKPKNPPAALVPNEWLAVGAVALRVLVAILDVGIYKGTRKITRRQIVDRTGIHATRLPAAIRELRAAGIIVTVEGDCYVTKEFDPKEGDFTKIERNLARDKRLSPGEYCVFLNVLSFRNLRTGVCRPSVATLVKLTRTSRATVLRHLAKLVELGLIVRVQQGPNAAAQTWFAHLDPKKFAKAVAGNPVRFSRHRDDEVPDENAAPDDSVPTDAHTTEAEFLERFGSHEDAPPLGDEDVPPIDGPEFGVADDLATFKGEYEERVGVAA